MLRAAACLTLLAVPAVARQESGRPATEMIRAAEEWIGRGDACKAVRLLEQAIARADSPSDRAACRDALRKAYPLAIDQASRSGRAAEAEEYRVNHEILERKASAAPRPESAAPARPGEPSTSAPSPAMPEPPTPLPRPEIAPSGPREAEAPTAEGATQGFSADVQPVAGSPPTDGSVRRTSGPPTRPGDDPIRERDTQPEPANDSTEPASRTAADSPADDAARIAEADDAFRAKRYGDAGAIYAELHEAGRLPRPRFDALAYCRRYAVVRRINDKPRDQQEWREIRAEIEAIRELTPNHWYDEYLLNLVSELSGRADGAPRAGGPARSHADGSGPISRYARPANGDGAADSAPREPRNEIARDVQLIDVDSEKWRVLKTANFLIYHADEQLAQQVAQAAESARLAAWRRWAGDRPLPPWTPPCYLYLFPHAGVFAAVTGQPADSPGFSTAGVLGGRVTSRRINLRAGHPKLIEAVLPHEVTHIILADLFGDTPIPRWADEGMAALSEPDAEQALRAGDLADELASPRLFEARDLLVMDYPDENRWPLYYAQSISLTRFLVERKGEQAFVRFLRDAQRNGYDAELARVYGIGGVNELQRHWRSDVAAALAGRPNEPAETAR
jgi:hypothetical protein